MNEPEEPDFPINEEELTRIPIWVNAGFGNRSYLCHIQTEDNTMTLPDGLVRELSLDMNDKLDWHFDLEKGILYVTVIRNDDWQPPEWLV